MRVLRIGLVAIALAACSEASGDERSIVASIYPLAFLAEQVAGPGWDVDDLTPPGVEAHDLELSLEQRTKIESAAIVLYLGDVGFQPQVERAIEESTGAVIAIADARATADPHVWLDAEAMASAAGELAAALARIDPENEQRYVGGAEAVASRLTELLERYRDGLTDCRFRSAIVTHEAFGFLLEPHGVEQLGLAGVAPESEPSAARLAEAHELIARGAAGAVFYDEHEESRDAAEAIARDAGVVALPLRTLESRPATGDYLTVMEENLRSLREGLRCR